MTRRFVSTLVATQLLACSDFAVLPSGSPELGHTSTSTSSETTSTGDEFSTGGETTSTGSDAPEPSGVESSSSSTTLDGEASTGASVEQCEITVLEALLLEDFGDGATGWRAEGQWSIGPTIASEPTGTCGFGDPGYDHSGIGDGAVAAVGLGVAALSTGDARQFLTSPPVDATNVESLTLSYWRWLNTAANDDVLVQVYDGLRWITVWQSAQPINEQRWSGHAFDVTDYASARFQVRFGFAVSEERSCGGWTLDDVRVDAVRCAPLR